MLKLAIDPGHGFANRKPGKYDSGAVANGHSEADIALQFGLTLNWACKDAGVASWMSRDDDRDVDPIGTRDDRAEAAGCSHFVALHLNAGGGHGVEVFYRDAQDKAFAQLVLQAALGATGLPSRGLKLESQSQHPRLAVLDFDGPACLVELGFIDNPADLRELLKRDVRIAFARHLVGGLKARV